MMADSIDLCTCMVNIHCAIYTRSTWIALAQLYRNRRILIVQDSDSPVEIADCSDTTSFVPQFDFLLFMVLMGKAAWKHKCTRSDRCLFVFIFRDQDILTKRKYIAASKKWSTW